jgi:hypothetical protein
MKKSIEIFSKDDWKKIAAFIYVQMCGKIYHREW